MVCAHLLAWLQRQRGPLFSEAVSGACFVQRDKNERRASTGQPLFLVQGHKI